MKANYQLPLRFVKQNVTLRYLQVTVSPHVILTSAGFISEDGGSDKSCKCSHIKSWQSCGVTPDRHVIPARVTPKIKDDCLFFSTAIHLGNSNNAELFLYETFLCVRCFYSLLWTASRFNIRSAGLKSSGFIFARNVTLTCQDANLRYL